MDRTKGRFPGMESGPTKQPHHFPSAVLTASGSKGRPSGLSAIARLVMFPLFNKKTERMQPEILKEELQVVRQFAINCLQITKNLFEILFILIYNDRRLGGLWKSYYRSQYLLERGAIKNEKNEDNGWQHRSRICFLCVYGSCSDLPDHSFFSDGRSK